jgi:RNA polymerase sigma factor (sigma-70 family)
MNCINRAEAARLHALAVVGDTDARDRLILAVWPIVYRRAIAFSKFPAATVAGLSVDDLAGEAAVFALRYLPRWDPKRAALTTWAAVVAWSAFRFACGITFAHRCGVAARVRAGVPLDADDAERIPDRPATESASLDAREAWALLSTLDKRSAAVLRARLVERDTLEAIGRRFGITKERVRQIESDALAKLRRRMGGD